MYRKNTATILKSAATVWLAVFLLPTGPGDAVGRGDQGTERPASDIGDVYINDSFEAADAIAKAQRLAETGHWIEAADLLQSTSERLGDLLIQLAPDYYVGGGTHINLIIAEWPETGIAAYRQRYEPEMIAKLRATGQRSELDEYLPLFDRYFCTATAAELADTIGQLAIEHGDLALAEHVYRQVLDYHPDSAVFDQRYRAMLTLLQVMRGGEASSIAEPDRQVSLRWMGRERPLAEIASEISGWSVGEGEATESCHWPIFGGSKARNRLGRSDIDEPGLLWRFAEYHSLESGTVDNHEEAFWQADEQRSLRLSSHLVVSGGMIYVQRSREVVALYSSTGAPAWRYVSAAIPSADFDMGGDQLPSLESVTVHDGRVYAAFPSDAAIFHGYEAVEVPPGLVCLDADTGRRIWSRNYEEFVEPFVEVSFDSSPIVGQGRLYVIARHRRSFGFEDCYLYRFRAVDGTLESRTHLGGASTGTFGTRRATTAIPALHDNTIFVCTNLGTIAAVSGHNGAVRWLRRYDRIVARDDAEAGWLSYREDPWRLNPTIWNDGRIITLPVDSTSVLVLADDDGRRLHNIPVADLGKADSLLGFRDDLLYTAGVEVACYDLGDSTLRWSSPLPADAHLWGRGVWVGDRLLIPTEQHLCVFAVHDGRFTTLPWAPEDGGGNLLALPDQLLVAGDDHIAAYVRKSEMWQRLQERAAATPANPLPALEMAEVALQGGEWARAVEALDQAVHRAGDLLEPIDPKLRQRFFDDVLRFADALSSQSAAEPEVLQKLLTYASRCPPDPAAHLTYRFRFGELFEQQGQPQSALRLYSQVLRDRTLRNHAASLSGNDSQSGGDYAKQRIEHLIERFGRSVFASLEAEAQHRLEVGRTTGDEGLLQSVLEEIPNSRAAPPALVALGGVLAKRQRYLDAIDCLADAYHHYPKQVDPVRLMRKIADAYESAGQLEPAYRWLTKAAREHPGATIEYEGRPVSFLEYRERLAAVRDLIEPSRPRISLPLSRHCARELNEGGRLLVPRFAGEPGTDWSKYFVYSGDSIQAFDVRNESGLWPTPALVRESPELLLATSKVAVLATRYEVLGLDVATGAQRWAHGEPPDELHDELGDWEEGPAFRTHAIRGGRLLSVREDGLATLIGLDDGQLIWSHACPSSSVNRIRLAGSWAVLLSQEQGNTTLNLLNAETGMPHQSITCDERWSIEDFFVTLDGQLIVVTSRSITSYDPDSGAEDWRVTLGGHVRPESVLTDLDTIYLSDDGRSVRKLSLNDGHALWESDRVLQLGERTPTLQQVGSSLILSTTASVSSIDGVTGLISWRGTTPESPQFVNRTVTQPYVVAVHLAHDEGTAYFYDHRNASGLIPRVGGLLPLGNLEDVRAVLVVDDGLLIQAGSTVHCWTGE